MNRTHVHILSSFIIAALVLAPSRGRSQGNVESKGKNAASGKVKGVAAAKARDSASRAASSVVEDQPESKTKAAPITGDSDDPLYDCPDKVKRGRYVVSLKPETSLDDLIKWAMTFHCKNFVYASNIGDRASKVTIMTPKKMTPQQAWRVFLVALQSMQLTVVPKGNVLEIIEHAKAKGAPLPIFSDGPGPASDQVIRVVLRPQHVSVDDLSSVLQGLKSANGDVNALSKSGIVVVTDFGTNVNQMSNLMLAVDQPLRGEQLYMLRVHNADATEIASKIEEIVGAPGGSARASATSSTRKKEATPATESPSAVAAAVPSKVIADERTNSLIVLGSKASYLRIKALVTRLDVGIDVEGGGRIHVYNLRHADAEELANTLTTLITGIEQRNAGTGGNRNNRTSADQANAPGQLQRSIASEGAAAFEGSVRVTHDKPTNALVIVATIKDFLALRTVIERLDSQRPQVYIEATIVEVVVDNSRNLGASFHGGKDVGDSLIIGGVQHNGLSSTDVTSLATAKGLIGGALGPLLSNSAELLGGLSIPSFGVLIQALANNSNVNILSTPHIITSNNEEAEISVGENIPYQSQLVGGLGGQAGATFLPTQSIQRQNVALTLKVTPQISSSDTVRLEVDLEISDIASRDFEGLGPSWSQQTIKNSPLVADQQSVVIGGLMRDRYTTSESKVPLLGDIPLLGYLFKYASRQKQKRNLLVVLTPHVIADQTDLQKILDRRQREQEEFVRSFSNFRSMAYKPEMDYRKKRGLLEEINRTIEKNERDAALLEELELRRIEIPDGPIEYLDSDDSGSAEGDEETPPADDGGDEPSEGSQGEPAAGDGDESVSEENDG